MYRFPALMFCLLAQFAPPLFAATRVPGPPPDASFTQWEDTLSLTCRFGEKTLTQNLYTKTANDITIVAAVGLLDGNKVFQIEILDNRIVHWYVKTADTDWTLFNSRVSGDKQESLRAIPIALGVSPEEWQRCLDNPLLLPKKQE